MLYLYLKAPQSLAGLLFSLLLSISGSDLDPALFRDASLQVQQWLTQLDPSNPLVVTATHDQRGQDGQCSLREAIEAINFDESVFECQAGSNQIVFDPSLTGATIQLNSSLAILQDLNIQGLGYNQLMISGNDQVRVLDIGPEAKVTVRDLTITRGYSDRGGAIYNQGIVELTNSILTSNSATEHGGAIFNRYNVSQVILNNSVVTRNTARDGGGLFMLFGSLSMVNSIVSDNTATNGGGIYNRSASVDLQDTTISGNTAAEIGGGLFNEEGTITLAASTVASNVARQGGGLANYLGTLTATSSAIGGNQANQGGGISASKGGTLAMQSCRISGNSGVEGGGFHILSSNLRLDNSILSDNSAQVGGAIFNDNPGTTFISRSTVSNNSSSSGNGSGIHNTGAGSLKLVNNQFSNSPNNVVGQAVGSDNTPADCNNGEC